VIRIFSLSDARTLLLGRMVEDLHKLVSQVDLDAGLKEWRFAAIKIFVVQKCQLARAGVDLDEIGFSGVPITHRAALNIDP
jgi:hypothetical protein